MSMRYRMLLIMTAAQVFASLVQWGMGSLAPFLVTAFHLSKAQLGMSFGAMQVGAALTGLFGGMAVDRFGERSMTSLAGVAVFLAISVAVVVPTLFGLIASLFLLGISYSVVSPAGGRAMLGWFTKDRGFAMSIRQCGIPGGAALGGLLLPFIASHADYRAAMLVGGVLTLAGTGGLPFFYREPPQTIAPVRGAGAYLEGLRKIVRDPRTIPFILACMVLNSVQQTSNSFIALSALVLGHTSIAVASLVFATSQIASILGRLFWGWASDRLFGGDRSLPLAIVCFVGSFAAAGFALTAPGNVPLLFAVAALLGFTTSGWTGLFAVALAEIGGTQFAGSALGFGSTLNFAAAATTPFIFGAIADRFGMGAGWFAVAGLLLAGTIPGLFAFRAFVRMRAAARELPTAG